LPDVPRHQSPYSGRTMWGLFLDEPERSPGHCSTCGHSEFVHGGRHEEHRCLYSQCECTEFGRIVDVTDPATVAVKPSGVLSPRWVSPSS